ncbi:MAG: hypothetical protein HQL71_13550 [Magnetococcales bacterium]|nr:hypothetical protein [Magnetococcales bacterium]
MTTKKKKDDCFVLMPISDPEGYDKGHFRCVYEDIISPACELANVNPIRADEDSETNLIQLKILKQLLDSPIAICDLSSRNPNVLFELGIRQAFDKPVVLIQEEGTPRIFDISGLRCLDYSKKMKYRDVQSFHNQLKNAIESTKDSDNKDGNVNSIIQLLALSESATIPNIEGNKKESLEFEILRSEIKDMKNTMDSIALNREILPYVTTDRKERNDIFRKGFRGKYVRENEGLNMFILHEIKELEQNVEKLLNKRSKLSKRDIIDIKEFQRTCKILSKQADNENLYYLDKIYIKIENFLRKLPEEPT